MGDLIGSAAVIVAAIIIVTTGWVQADAIASLLIAAMIIPRAITLLREVVSVLSESTPKGMHVTEIRDHILDTPGVVDCHDVHVWQLTRGAPVFTAHVVEGRWPGRLAAAASGGGGFGYDPIFVPDGQPAGAERTVGEWSAAEKNTSSHRARAFTALQPLLAAL